MRLRDWSGRPRHVLVVYSALAVVSVGAVAWLGFLLLQQDSAFEADKRRSALEHAADAATATMSRALAALDARRSDLQETRPLPAGITVARIGPGGFVAFPPVLFTPEAVTRSDESSPRFMEGERLEFSEAKLTAAARAYEELAKSRDASVHAGAMARLARVRRKLNEPAAALHIYERLAAVPDDQRVDALPASLLARAGRATVYHETGANAALREEAARLMADLTHVRWRLSESQYRYYAAEAQRWGATVGAPCDEVARAEAVSSVWRSARQGDGAGQKLLQVPGGPVLVSWSPGRTGVIIIVAGPDWLDRLARESVSPGAVLEILDSDGRRVAPSHRRHQFDGCDGAGPDAASRSHALATTVGPSAVRIAAATGLPWTLRVWAGTTEPASASPRRGLLIASFGLMILVVVAGWFSIGRATARELRVSALQADFVAAVSHEFRSPLTSLAHVAELLAHDRLPSEESRVKAYEVLLRDTERLRALVEGVLDFRRFSAPGALRLERLDVIELVRSTVSEFQERIAPEGYVIEMSGPTAAIASVDGEALSRALWNLLDNAIKYSPDRRRIWVDVDHTGEVIAIAVRDEGIGIATQEQGRIFDQFVRGAETKRLNIKGTGIGLATVRQIVEAHGGQVMVKSVPGLGSRFTMVLHTREGQA